MHSEFDLQIKWIAFPLHPETPLQGRSLEELFSGRNIDIPQLQKRLKQIARELALPYGNRDMTFNSRRAQELGKWAEQMGKGEAFHTAVFRAYFADGQNIGDINTLSDIALSVGLSGDEARGVLEAGDFRAAVDADWSRSNESRVTAVPTFLMNGQSLVGAQSYEALANFMVQNRVSRRSVNH